MRNDASVLKLGCAVATVVATCLALATAAAAETSLANPPPGANNFACEPSAAHPDPVVLVHGLGATMSENWRYLSPILAAHGYCVFALTYGVDPREPGPWFGGVIPIEQSAHELGRFVDQVLAATGAQKVDLVGHSEGTFMPEYWLKFLGGAAKVNRYVALTPLYAGTDFIDAAQFRDAGQQYALGQLFLKAFSSLCGSCEEFIAGSDMVKQINSGPGGAAVPGVTYTTIPTKHDELVVPYTSGILNAPNVTNYILQDVCPNDISDHGAEAFDPVVAQIVLNALDPASAKAVSCAGLPPFAPSPS
jgi:triacylglycerol esterase/lipase EstA (alpha/beta hydrolase family)